MALGTNLPIRIRVGTASWARLAAFNLGKERLFLECLLISFVEG